MSRTLISFCGESLICRNKIHRRKFLTNLQKDQTKLLNWRNSGSFVSRTRPRHGTIDLPSATIDSKLSHGTQCLDREKRRSSISIDQTSGSGGHRQRSIWYLNEVISVGNYDNHLITVLVLRFMNDICNFYACNFTFVWTIIHDRHLKLYLPCHVLNYLSNILSYE